MPSYPNENKTAEGSQGGAAISATPIRARAFTHEAYVSKVPNCHSHTPEIVKRRFLDTLVGLCLLHVVVPHNEGIRRAIEAPSYPLPHALVTSPASDVDRPILAVRHNIRQALIPALLVHQRLVQLILARIGVHPPVFRRDPDLKHTRAQSGMYE